ncbi:FAD-binding oxidoreductase [Croceicoccus sp. BE223]|uniref:NAD(P)/FAD-dependent oxidoreductase n=1 Tax=Croceicoccus sp. BE223 TaxID=2817716 RepID=UPI00285BE21C|nr:FAD-binding oxidoreductase [Croceicoccus sp. BE223]MDR7103625.1 glycine/D-amino acid oxidase-like deaminating enzyme [Croceicoccus sp. BE223]
MSPYVKRIESDEHLPESADVVIVGGGIVGVSAAYVLARQGHSVALVEKGHIACEQSSRNWGWCRQQNRDARELPISSVAMRMWDGFMADLPDDVGFRRCGLFYATDNEKQMAEWAAWQPYGLANGVDTRLLSAAEIAQHIPEGPRKWIGGISSPNDGKAEPALAGPAIALGARAHGATIHQQCAARSLDIANGRVVGVHTERGLIRANAVLCAAGAWASRFLRPHGISFPQAGVRQTALRTRPTVDVGACLYAPDFAMTRRLDGSYTMAISGKATIDITPQGIRYAREFLPQFRRRLKNVRLAVGPSFVSGPESLFAQLRDDETIFERTRVLDPAPQQWLVRRILANVAATFPELAGVEIEGAWGALVDCSPDAVPVISKVEQVAGLVLAAGASGHGFGMGPGIGALAADLLVDNEPCVDPTPFRLSRLVDGSPLDIGGL